MAILIPDNRFDLLLIFAPNGYAWASVPIILIMSGILILTGIILFAVGVKIMKSRWLYLLITIFIILAICNLNMFVIVWNVMPDIRSIHMPMQL